jgi:hypothetical protein
MTGTPTAPRDHTRDAVTCEYMINQPFEGYIVQALEAIAEHLVPDHPETRAA